jgi:hypothetical protein
MMEEPKVDISLAVNGKDVPMNPFVRLILTNVLDAIVRSLRLEGEPREIEIKLKH